jgi:hypothetical protein
MGEAIARFREVALAIRRKCDERHSQPRGMAVQVDAAKKFASRCRIHLVEHEKAGMPYPARYIHGLCRFRNDAETKPDPPPPGHLSLPDYIEWLPDPREPGDSEFRDAIRSAIKEAVEWGSLFPVVEARIKAAEAAADMLIQCAAAAYYCPSGGEDGDRADADYIARHEEFAEALDALAPFVTEPPKPATPGSEKQTGGSRGRGGRPQNDEDLARDLLAGWKAYEPEEGRKTKDRYLAQRPDVRAVKTEDARQRKIASLRVALDSALHLRAEKARQKKRAHG